MSTPSNTTFYVTTPIYYVNDRPHIGHIYTTTLADVLARYHRLRGDDVMFLTGTDEHAAKVADAAASRSMTTQAWADQNAEAFRKTFEKLGMSHDDFIRTTEDRHKSRVLKYVQELLDRGDIYEGEYEGWYDAGQEEYVPENKAAETDFKSPITGKPLVKKKEKNYFFALSRYQERLLAHMEQNRGCVRPEARRNEVLSRIREGLNDVPVSRTGSGGWGISMPSDPEQTIYVWIDALMNYLTTVDKPDRIKYWPANVQLIAKDILWFHAVIWPALLMALDRPLPAVVYSHSFWISEGQKMSKMLGNFIDLEKIDGYVEKLGLDALRWFLATQGPLGATDSDFSEAKFLDIYNSDLANTIGNCASRVANMIGRYFEGKVPTPGDPEALLVELRELAEGLVEKVDQRFENLDVAGANQAAVELVRAIDGTIEKTQPFKLAKDPDNLPRVGTILYFCAEALRVAALTLVPTMPGKMDELLSRLGAPVTHEGLAQLGAWGLLEPGGEVVKGDPLFPRIQE